MCYKCIIITGGIIVVCDISDALWEPMFTSFAWFIQRLKKILWIVKEVMRAYFTSSLFLVMMRNKFRFRRARAHLPVSAFNFMNILLGICIWFDCEVFFRLDCMYSHSVCCTSILPGDIWRLLLELQLSYGTIASVSRGRCRFVQLWVSWRAVWSCSSRGCGVVGICSSYTSGLCCLNDAKLALWEPKVIGGFRVPESQLPVLCWQQRHPSDVLCCCSPSAPRLDTTSALRWSSASLGARWAH